MKSSLNMASISSHFDLPLVYESHAEIHSGLINQTYLVHLIDPATGEDHPYIFQRINTNVFRNPYHVMENIIGVTEHFKSRLIAEEGSWHRRVLSFALSKEGVPYYESAEDGFWRAYEFVDKTVAYNAAPSGDRFFQAGKAFGTFQRYLTDYDATTLHETIPNFHNTVTRFEALKTAVQENRAGRLNDVQRELNFALAREADAGLIVKALESGEIPYRVTHNDTKINNVLFDVDTDEAICVIDLDTIMPGAALYDFGDAIRSGASTAAEDEPNLDNVEMNLNMYRLFTKGFIKGTHTLLSEKEIMMMPLGAKTMTLECGIRFLTDYLNGDTYFHTDYSGQNLLRARTQLKLVADMEAKMGQMKGYAEQYSEQYATRFASGELK
ncbi:MAG: aminoglycoside phosphotransferase family protein [Clostridia bacterium]|nr:aminoglycoside phosphotransferase family protein [Clostridia bacterium]